MKKSISEFQGVPHRIEYVTEIDGVRYYAERPHDCRKCFFWKNKKVGCTLGSKNCYYLAEVIKTEQEKKCENCPYAKGQPCVSASCYKDLEKWLRQSRAKTVQRMMKEGGVVHVG